MTSKGRTRTLQTHRGLAGLRSEAEESNEFTKFHRIEPAQFDYILRKIDPVIARFDTKFRKSISSAVNIG